MVPLSTALYGGASNVTAATGREIRRLRTEMSRGGGYILVPAKPIRQETPTENVPAVLEEFLAAEG